MEFHLSHWLSGLLKRLKIKRLFKKIISTKAPPVANQEVVAHFMAAPF